MLEELAKIAAVDRLVVHTARDTAETLRFLTTNSRRPTAVVGARSAAELRQARVVRTWAEFCAAVSPPEPVSHAFGRMLLNVHGLSAAKVAHVLARYPTPRRIVEAVDAHKAACATAREEGWLFAEVLEPGRRLRKLSETLTAFVSDEVYAAANDEGASQAEAGATQESQAYYG